MTKDRKPPGIPLPAGWPQAVGSAMLHVNTDEDIGCNRDEDDASQTKRRALRPLAFHTRHSVVTLCIHSYSVAPVATNAAISAHTERYPPQSSGPEMNPGMGKLFTASTVF